MARGIQIHADIQGSELEMLEGAEQLVIRRKVGYFFVSTHNQTLHTSCRAYLETRGYEIIAAADFDNETSGCDGLLVARLAELDGAMPMDIGSRIALRASASN